MIKKEVKSDILIALFWALDYNVLIGGKRNRLQEELLNVFADNCGIESA